MLNQPISVSDLTHNIQAMFDNNPAMKSIEVEGELSNFVRARSGHLYFTLKDAKSQIRGVMWRSSAERLQFDPQDGDAVLLRGKVSVYAPQGQYQFTASSMKPLGMGDLAMQFELLKRSLLEEGLFDEIHKQPLPAFPKKIGIVTSANAAALRDILNVLRRRYPIAEILIAPTLVQGKTAPPNIVRALNWIDGREDVDLIILSRGGGSIEDLWAFNNEEVARTVFHCDTPIITGVGHEIDFTIVDFVADKRAPTPSAAAELAVPDLSQLKLSLQEIKLDLQNILSTRMQERQTHLQTLERALTHLSPERTVKTDVQRVDQLTHRLQTAMRQTIQSYQQQIAIHSAELAGLNPMTPLERGYALVRNEAGELIRSAKSASENSILTIQWKDGSQTVERQN